jgi:hypothetical protein
LCESGACNFRQAYTEGSTWDAIQVKDRVYCGGSDVLDAVDPKDEKYSIEFMFGCQTSMTGLFVTQLADGIIGMAAHPATLPKQLFDMGKIEHNLFALCYRRELGTSKRGVYAGSMSLGGVSTSLDSSPIIYARNLAKFGWYTVYVKNIYIRSGGGQSAHSVGRDRRTVRVRMDTAALNSGKGVIVDSGTTDTYLNVKVAREFNRAWKKVTGVAYSHTPISLTQEQLRQLPTILIQCQAASIKKDPSIEDYDSIPGYTGSLDPSSPEDLLIAVPATSYMDYSPITRRYMSRLYFTETAGSVLGSNTMQGHNVVFDWENGRVGFAESTCAYDKKDTPEAALDAGYSTDCVVSDPIVSKSCIESVEKSLCRHNPTNVALLGTEKWTSIVESTGTDTGISCVMAANDVSDNDPREKSVVTCSGEGTCEEERPCQLTCSELTRAVEVAPLSEGKQQRFKCGESSWSACDYNCKQARIKSLAFSDGLCHEAHRESRPCHIGACARSDPCLVPYIIHAVVGFKGGSVSKWTEETDDVFGIAMVEAVEKMLNRTLFEAGDVHVLAALPWYEEDNDIAGKAYQRDVDVLGFRVVVEISVFNNQTDLVELQRINAPEKASAGPASSFFKRKRTTAPQTIEENSCGPDTLYQLAKHALDVKKVLLNEGFMGTLVSQIKRLPDPPGDSPFSVVFTDDFSASDDVIVLAWTVRTEVEDEINYFGPQKPFMATLYTVLHAATVASSFFLIVLTVWSSIWTCHEYCQGKRHGLFLLSGPQYRSLDVDEDADAIEKRAILGTAPEGGSTEHFMSTSKLTRLKQRFRASGSMGNGNER